MPVCLIALGSNENASEALFQDALRELERSSIASRALSRIVTTRPVGPESGPPFLNAAATVECHLSPLELLRELQRVESAFGRTRTLRWGPRTLDLDLLLYGDEIIDQPDLVVPHPAMWYRRFVLDPAHDVAAGMNHPVLQSTVSSLYRALHARPLHVCLELREKDAESAPDIHNMIERLQSDRTGLMWHESDDTGNIGTPWFARIILQRRSGILELQTQPRNTGDRSIIVESETEEQSHLQLLQLAAAMLG